MHRLALFILVLVCLTGCNLRQGPAPTLTPAPTPDRPRVQFTYPENNAAVIEGTDLRIDLLADDPGDGVARVELLVDDVPVSEGTPEISQAVPTFAVTLNWLAQGAGLHSLSAVAYRLDGTTSEVVTIVVQVIPRETPTP
jgi:hypothetical protein